MTDTYPFKASNINVAKARDLFPVRKTLVVPIFPEPTFLMSCFKKILVINKPNGIEPKKYE